MTNTISTAEDITRDVYLGDPRVPGGAWTTQGPDSSGNYVQVVTIGDRRFVLGDEEQGLSLVGYSWSIYEADDGAPEGWELMTQDGSPDDADAYAALTGFVESVTHP